MTQFTYVSRHPQVLSRKLKYCLGKLYGKYGLRNPQEEPFLSQESAKDCECFLVFWGFFFALEKKSSFVDTYAFFTNLTAHFKTVFPKTLKGLETLINHVTKCITAKIYPMEVKISSLSYLGFLILFFYTNFGL